MGEIVFGSIVPHGFSIIEELAGDELELFRPTRNAMKKFGEIVLEERPDTIVILTPHGLRLRGYNSIYLCEYSRGSLSQNNETVSLDFKCDKEMAELILREADREGIEMVGCNFGALEGLASNIEMDWGSLIPLWYCRDPHYQPEIVVIGPSRDIELDKLVRLGQIIGKISLSSDKKVGIIASADQGHCHDENGPYGFNRASKEYDKHVIEIIKNNDFNRLLQMDHNFVDDAKPDSLWQMLILKGVLDIKPMEAEFLSYEVPTYFGMIVSNYR